MAPEPAEVSKDLEMSDDTGDFPESSDLCDFGYVLVRRENSPAGQPAE